MLANIYLSYIAFSNFLSKNDPSWTRSKPSRGSIFYILYPVLKTPILVWYWRINCSDKVYFTFLNVGLQYAYINASIFSSLSIARIKANTNINAKNNKIEHKYPRASKHIVKILIINYKPLPLGTNLYHESVLFL
jgi:hypothetical protein